jgi:hypothetical protein
MDGPAHAGSAGIRGGHGRMDADASPGMVLHFFGLVDTFRVSSCDRNP